MIKTETFTQPAQEKTRTVAVICDVCKKEHTGATEHGGEVKWPEGNHIEHETTLKLYSVEYTGYYDGGGDGKEIVVHICVDCFRTRLIPWLEQQGARVETRDFDF